MGNTVSVIKMVESLPASIRWASEAASKSVTRSKTGQTTSLDSTYIQGWLPQKFAVTMFQTLVEIGAKQGNQKATNAEITNPKSKYPLWTKYYGYRRSLDGALALDKWGSNYESWVRVTEPPDVISFVCRKLKRYFNLPEESLNSIVVNYYFDGASTYIPAHRDTTSSLQENSSIYCLSLGAVRDFVLCSTADAGKYVKSDLQIEQEFRVEQGDLFVLGPRTNETFCHAIPQESAQSGMRISIIFRTVDKSFIDLHAAPRLAVYDGTNKQRIFSAQCVTTTGFNDLGKREHLADLVNYREAQKRLRREIARKLAPPTSTCQDGDTAISAAEDDVRSARNVSSVNTANELVTGKHNLIDKMHNHLVF